jgi:hypothetical protein
MTLPAWTFHQNIQLHKFSSKAIESATNHRLSSVSLGKENVYMPKVLLPACKSKGRPTYVYSEISDHYQ